MTQIHPNYAKAAKLMIVSFVVSCIVMIKNFWSMFQIDDAVAQTSIAMDTDGFKSMVMVSIIINTVYFFVMVYLIRQGYYWMKYLLLGILAWMLFSLATSGFDDLITNAVDGIIIVIRVWMIVLLFQIPKDQPA